MTSATWPPPGQTVDDCLVRPRHVVRFSAWIVGAVTLGVIGYWLSHRKGWE